MIHSSCRANDIFSGGISVMISDFEVKARSSRHEKLRRYGHTFDWSEWRNENQTRNTQTLSALVTSPGRPANTKHKCAYALISVLFYQRQSSHCNLGTERQPNPSYTTDRVLRVSGDHQPFLEMPTQPSSRAIPWPAKVPYDKQAFPVRNTKRPGQSAHYRNGIWGLVDEHTPGVFTTLDQIWAEGLSLGPSNEFLGWRPLIGPDQLANHYEWITYTQADERRKHIGSFVHSLFSSGKVQADHDTTHGTSFETVGIWAPNRPEWQLVDIALQSYGKVGVGLYDTLGKDSVEYIINHAALPIIFASQDHIPALLKLSPKVPTLKYIIVLPLNASHPLPEVALEVLKQWGAELGVDVLTLNEAENIGKVNPVQPIPATPDSVATICYTSGTTNVPKGVVLKHKTLAMSIQSYFYGRDLPDGATLFSYLPLAHIYERMVELCSIATNGRIGYFSGKPLFLLQDAQILKPHFFPSVPRVLNRIYQSAMLTGKEAPGIKGALFRKALETKLDRFNKTGEVHHALWDRLVFKKVQAALGGQIMFIGSGSAPITPAVLNFLKIAFTCDVVEGYGLTETAACCSRTWQGEEGSKVEGTDETLRTGGTGTVGPSAPVNEVKLVDVSTMGYTAEDNPYPRGELCVRGVVVFSHYHKDEKNTREALDSEGWFHTGDIASIDTAGRIKIIDRLKNIMKLSQGEYIALEKVENAYSATTPLAAQLFVYGEPTQPYVVGVVVPEPIAFARLVESVLGKVVDFGQVIGEACEKEEQERVVRDPRVVAKVLEVLTKEAQKTGLKGFELVKRIHLTLSPFSVDDNTLTPTMKLRRKDAYLKFKTDIDALYALGEPSIAGGSSSSRGAGAIKL